MAVPLFVRYLYSLIRNGMWEDAAVARTDPVFQNFKNLLLLNYSTNTSQEVVGGISKNPTIPAPAAPQQGGPPPRAAATSYLFTNAEELVAPYLTWRFSYLVCGSFFGLWKIILDSPIPAFGGKSYEELKQDYKKFLQEQLPVEVSLDEFDSLLEVLTYEDLGFFIVSIVSVFFTIVSVLLLLSLFRTLPRAVGQRRSAVVSDHANLFPRSTTTRLGTTRTSSVSSSPYQMQICLLGLEGSNL